MSLEQRRPPPRCQPVCHCSLDCPTVSSLSRVSRLERSRRFSSTPYFASDPPRVSLSIIQRASSAQHVSNSAEHTAMDARRTDKQTNRHASGARGPFLPALPHQMTVYHARFGRELPLWAESKLRLSSLLSVARAFATAPVANNASSISSSDTIDREIFFVGLLSTAMPFT